MIKALICMVFYEKKRGNNKSATKNSLDFGTQPANKNCSTLILNSFSLLRRVSIFGHQPHELQFPVQGRSTQTKAFRRQLYPALRSEQRFIQ